MEWSLCMQMSLDGIGPIVLIILVEKSGVHFYTRTDMVGWYFIDNLEKSLKLYGIGPAS